MIPEGWTERLLGDLLDYEQPTKYLVESTEYDDSGTTPVLTAGKSFILGYTSETEGLYDKGPTILFDDFTTATQWVDFPFKVKSSACKMLTARDSGVSLRLVYELMKTIPYVPSDHMRHWIGIASKWTVAVPPAAEQQAIAEAISDAAALVESLNALIAKKRDMKQAAMQRCKTPDRIGVPAALKRLSDVVEVRKGELITSSTSGEGDIPVIAGGKEPAYFTNRFNREGLTITVSASGANAGYVALRSGPLWASDCSTVSATEDFDITFLAAQMLVRQDAVYRMQFGGAQPHVRPNDLASLEICIPSLEDQRRLGRVFMDMDAEIEALVAQREKAELVKQGMMQELLSGRVRLS